MKTERWNLEIDLGSRLYFIFVSAQGNHGFRCHGNSKLSHCLSSSCRLLRNRLARKQKSPFDSPSFQQKRAGSVFGIPLKPHCILKRDRSSVFEFLHFFKI
ncbi:uncharacterized protein LOC111087310 [Limulus polyphemus]|uniref:Uncharacterized protein LOC111087310 n=1 Tax=Limulus polyphemus TaxID=6850 RepID=A0ABM1T038_LIMPO|nr:uncharacterized protein LOC111087310 [Limulus polyphemus]